MCVRVCACMCVHVCACVRQLIACMCVHVCACVCVCVWLQELTRAVQLTEWRQARAALGDKRQDFLSQDSNNQQIALQTAGSANTVPTSSASSSTIENLLYPGVDTRPLAAAENNQGVTGGAPGSPAIRARWGQAVDLRQVAAEVPGSPEIAAGGDEEGLNTDDAPIAVDASADALVQHSAQSTASSSTIENLLYPGVDVRPLAAAQAAETGVTLVRKNTTGQTPSTRGGPPPTERAQWGPAIDLRNVAADVPGSPDTATGVAEVLNTGATVNVNTPDAARAQWGPAVDPRNTIAVDASADEQAPHPARSTASSSTIENLLYPGVEQAAGAFLATDGGKDQTKASPAGKITHPVLSPKSTNTHNASNDDSLQRSLAITQGDSTVKALLYPTMPDGSDYNADRQVKPKQITNAAKRAEQQRVSHFKTQEAIVARHNGDAAKMLMYKLPAYQRYAWRHGEIA